LRDFWSGWHQSGAPARALALETSLQPGAIESIGAHPVLIRKGERLALNDSDNKVAARHPRTLAGWTADGELLLVTIDGRQPGHSAGATLAEAADVMLALGATNAVNLDGGGSTTFVGPCDAGSSCVLNRPSDRRERHVSSALVLVPRDGVVVNAAQAKPPTPTPPPAPAPVRPLVVEERATPTVEPAPAPAPVVAAAAPAPEPQAVVEAKPLVGANEVAAPVWPERTMRTDPLPLPHDPGRRLPLTLVGLAALGIVMNATRLAARLAFAIASGEHA
ncbi:MAG: phosphodiester glycosidase family protein, partial [Acidimicrobiales bacterium]